MWLLENAGTINLSCAVAVLLAGGIIYWFVRPKVFRAHPFANHAFTFWLIQWFMLIVTWAAYSSSGSHKVVILATIDLYGVATLGFFWVYLEAAHFRWAETVRNIVGVYGLLLVWNIVVGPLAMGKPAGSHWRWVWILPSESISALSLFLVAWVFLRRYKGPAIPLSCVVIPLYIFLQRPTYYSIFVGTIPAGWVLALAVWKLVYGLLFYTLFFLPAQTYEPIGLPHFHPSQHWFSKSGRWFLGAIGGVIVSVLSTYFSQQLGDLLERLSAPIVRK